ncbi:hypothetical protein PMAYCL1PPCAC_31732, partial [Pristionchus mayeri]
DLPSVFAIDQVKVRVNYERFLYSEPFPVWFEEDASPSEDLKTDLFTRHLDQTDLIMAVVRSAEVKDHVTDDDVIFMKRRRSEDCELIDNAEYRQYLKAYSWWQKIFMRWFVTHYDCSFE